MGFLARRFIRGNLHFVKSKKSHFYQQILRLTRFKRNLSVLYFRSLLFRNGWMGLKKFSKLTIKTPAPPDVSRFRVFIVNFEQILLTFPALKIKILLVPVNWSLRHRSRLSSYLPRRSQDCYFPFDKNELEQWIVQFWRLKASVKSLQIGLYSVFFKRAH